MLKTKKMYNLKILHKPIKFGKMSNGDIRVLNEKYKCKSVNEMK